MEFSHSSEKMVLLNGIFSLALQMQQFTLACAIISMYVLMKYMETLLVLKLKIPGMRWWSSITRTITQGESWHFSRKDFRSKHALMLSSGIILYTTTTLRILVLRSEEH